MRFALVLVRAGLLLARALCGGESQGNRVDECRSSGLTVSQSASFESFGETIASLIERVQFKCKGRVVGGAGGNFLSLPGREGRDSRDEAAARTWHCAWPRPTARPAMPLVCATRKLAVL